MRTILVLIAAALSIEAQSSAPLGVPWNRTPEAFAGKYVILQLTSGTRIEGHWASVTPDTFTFRVTKTSNEFKVGKGVQTLPRSSIERVRAGVRRARGRGWGLGLGIYAGGNLAAQSRSPQAACAILAGVVGTGYFIGRSADLATREVTLLPEIP